MCGQSAADVSLLANCFLVHFVYHSISFRCCALLQKELQLLEFLPQELLYGTSEPCNEHLTQIYSVTSVSTQLSE